MMDLGTISPDFNASLFQLSIWFKENESFSCPQQISNVMLSLGDENGSTLQIGSNGQTLEVFMATAVRSQRISIGSGVKTGQWHHLMVSYDENVFDSYELKVYLDGKLAGTSSELGGLLQVKPTDFWLLGASSKESQKMGDSLDLLTICGFIPQIVPGKLHLKILAEDTVT